MPALVFQKLTEQSVHSHCMFSSFGFQNIIISWKDFNLCAVPFYSFPDFIYLSSKYQAIPGLSFCLDSLPW